LNRAIFHVFFPFVPSSIPLTHPDAFVFSYGPKYLNYLFPSIIDMWVPRQLLPSFLLRSSSPSFDNRQLHPSRATGVAGVAASAAWWRCARGGRLRRGALGRRERKRVQKRQDGRK
jgi:hypothetical protein